MRILIAEEALQYANGHWPSYISCIAAGLRAEGDQVDVLTHRDVNLNVLETLQGTPWFSRNCWTDPRSQGGIGGILHNLRFRREVINWLVKREPYVWICALTVRLQHLLAFALLLRDGRIPKSSRCLLLFVQGFGQYIGIDQPSSFPRNASTFLARRCFSMLAPAVRSGRVVLAAETQGMQDELKRFTGLPIALFPHPVPPPNFQLVSASRQSPRSNSRITVVCPGFARHEKGNDLLQEAIKSILLSREGRDLRFVIQWPSPFTMPDGSKLGPDSILLKNPHVEFLNQNLDAKSYETLLGHTDLVILPYRRNSYHHRVSRVAIEAASRGIPLIYTLGTWSGSVAKLAGGGVAIQEETVESIIGALRQAMQNFDSLRGTALVGAGRVADFHSASEFRRCLIGD